MSFAGVWCCGPLGGCIFYIGFLYYLGTWTVTLLALESTVETLSDRDAATKSRHQPVPGNDTPRAEGPL